MIDMQAKTEVPLLMADERENYSLDNMSLAQSSLLRIEKIAGCLGWSLFTDLVSEYSGHTYFIEKIPFCIRQTGVHKIGASF